MIFQGVGGSLIDTIVKKNLFNVRVNARGGGEASFLRGCKVEQGTISTFKEDENSRHTRYQVYDIHS